MIGLHLLIYAKRKMLVDDGEDEPTHGDVCLGLQRRESIAAVVCSLF